MHQLPLIFELQAGLFFMIGKFPAENDGAIFKAEKWSLGPRQGPFMEATFQIFEVFWIFDHILSFLESINTNKQMRMPRSFHLRQSRTFYGQK